MASSVASLHISVLDGLVTLPTSSSKSVGHMFLGTSTTATYCMHCAAALGLYPSDPSAPRMLPLTYSLTPWSICSHRSWYLALTASSLDASWFLSCRPACLLATELLPPWTRMSDRVLSSCGRLFCAACSRKFCAAVSSFWSENLRVNEYETKILDKLINKGTSLFYKSIQGSRKCKELKGHDKKSCCLPKD